MNSINRFLRSAARIARRRGLSLEMQPHDIGDFFHVYGHRGSPSTFVSMLQSRGRSRA